MSDHALATAAYRVCRPLGGGDFVLLCDHASNHIPDEYAQLGLPADARARHIAYDIGAAGVAVQLSALLDSPAILCGTSRLLIDANRQQDARDRVPEVSDGTPIPGNRDLTPAAIDDRVARWFTPYHDAIESVLAEHLARLPRTMVLSIHTMTDRLNGIFRPWQIALSSHQDRRLVEPMLTALRRAGDLTVGDNQPYELNPAIDYSIPYHAIRRNLPYLQVEFRQDLVADDVGQAQWARRFADALRAAGLREAPV